MTKVTNLIIMATILFGTGFAAGKEIYNAKQKREEIEKQIRNNLRKNQRQIYY